MGDGVGYTFARLVVSVESGALGKRKCVEKAVVPYLKCDRASWAVKLGKLAVVVLTWHDVALSFAPNQC